MNHEIRPKHDTPWSPCGRSPAAAAGAPWAGTLPAARGTSSRARSTHAQQTVAEKAQAELGIFAENILSCAEEDVGDWLTIPTNGSCANRTLQQCKPTRPKTYYCLAGLQYVAFARDTRFLKYMTPPAAPRQRKQRDTDYLVHNVQATKRTRPGGLRIHPGRN